MMLTFSGRRERAQGVASGQGARHVSLLSCRLGGKGIDVARIRVGQGEDNPRQAMADCRL